MTTNDQTMGDQPIDHVPPDAESAGKPERSDLEKNVTQRSTWVRLIFMIIIGFLYAISRVVTAAVIIIQFFYVLITAKTNHQLKTLGHSLAIYSLEVVDFMTFNTESRPFPFDRAWPTDLPQAEAQDSEEE